MGEVAHPEGRSIDIALSPGASPVLAFPNLVGGGICVVPTKADLRFALTVNLRQTSTAVYNAEHREQLHMEREQTGSAK